ncbi:ornithine cyclodeaminase family protein [Parasedimentitalea huanghaiensis]|uniref:Ornithine cyclodeaminase family protein n=1 Tax=Parasedimentitalea huanghaiensis TaxID=2682100 RepID=A0A6L6WL27_9RHOB|nr:ornithine cyclodeaminase family protein [Zongyanglinia huanghaiensis]MVO17315.1 ornithine cyclodeaminase family protein [Zongyanglinia huanghaiensis]
MRKNTPTILNADQVAGLIGKLDLATELRGMFAELGQKQAIQPAQTVTLFPEDRGDFITYLGAQGQSGVFGAKLSPYLVTEGKPIITAWTLLLSMETGEPLLLCDSGQLTTERTAGTTALAVDLLASPKAASLAIIGSGSVAQAHYRHVMDLREWDTVRIYSPGLGSDTARQNQWRDLCKDVVFVDSAEAAATNADVVMLCTSCGRPVIANSAIGPNTLVTSISTNVAQAHEVNPDWLSAAQVYCDYRATTPNVAGEMVLAAQDHGWNPDEIRGDLAELTNDLAPKPEKGKPSFFRSVGLGLEDIAAAQAVLRCLEGAN